MRATSLQNPLLTNCPNCLCRVLMQFALKNPVYALEVCFLVRQVFLWIPELWAGIFSMTQHLTPVLCSDFTTAGNPLVCLESRFKCRNGRCVDRSFLCNGQDNCQDNSDEELCLTTAGTSLNPTQGCHASSKTKEEGLLFLNLENYPGRKKRKSRNSWCCWWAFIVPAWFANLKFESSQWHVRCMRSIWFKWKKHVQTHSHLVWTCHWSIPSSCNYTAPRMVVWKTL